MTKEQLSILAWSTFLAQGFTNISQDIHRFCSQVLLPSEGSTVVSMHLVQAVHNRMHAGIPHLERYLQQQVEGNLEDTRRSTDDNIDKVSIQERK